MIGSLCSGYGGLDRALAALFREPISWHAEIDDAAKLVLKARFPDVRNHGDITIVDWERERGIERPRVIAAGIPCQPFSAAGRQRGTADHRYLWPAGRSAIASLRPEWIALENVRNLVSIDKGVVFAGILADLRSLGYAVAWGVFGACLAEIGGCHHRHRVFILGRRTNSRSDSPTPPAVRWTDKACGVPRWRAGELLPTPVARDGDSDGRKGRGEGSAAYWARKATEGRTNGMPLGAALTLLPTPQHRDGRDGSPSLNAETAQRRNDAGRRNLEDSIALLPTSRATDGANGGPNQRGRRGDLAMPSAVQPEHFGRYANAVARWSAIHGLPPAPTVTGPRGGLRLAPEFPEWMMGLAAGYVSDVVGRTDALRLIGNGVFPLQAYHAFKTLIETLDAS